MNIQKVREYLLALQKKICACIESEDAEATFILDPWEYPQGGGGISCALTRGHVVEKGGVNFSHVHGMELPKAATVSRPELVDSHFQAMGVSVVIHPLNPYAPTSHFNVRCILVEKPNQEPVWWFGGGFDLTPYYGFVEDCQHWHAMAKAACDPFGADVYAKYKKWADDYFYLKHRQEPRGIGGIFFDDLNQWDFDTCFAFMQSVGEHYLKAYQPILARRKQHPFTQNERDFQLFRRGRYVEFNLLYDRGTLFGLQSGGRTESILMSLPPLVAWHYQYQPQPNSIESQLYDDYLKPRAWIS